ncbi:CGCGG family rSAM-modified RiPP protein [Cytobacillus suaedae]|nr:CGCGG family rSAM-modified RiPP protein [Cytobacillus suaedae]
MDRDWSMNLEEPEYENDINLLIEKAIKAVQQTKKGCYVNLVTPVIFGNPTQFLSTLLDEVFNKSIRHKYIDHCGCGGYVYRVWKL